MSVDLDAYFARIGYDGPRTPTLATLQHIQALHPASIPYENLDPLIHRCAPALDLASLEAKLIRQRRGGYCYEHNTLLRHVLMALGFHVTPLLGRVRWMVPDEVATACTHKVLRVDLDGRIWIADVGFGGATPTAALRLEPDVEQTTPHEPYRVIRHGDGFETQIRLGGAWQPLYRYTLEPQSEIDYVGPNWFASTHPDAFFTNTLSVARILPSERLSLRGLEFTRRRSGEPAVKMALRSPEELLRTLREPFGIDVPADMRFERLFDAQRTAS